MKKSFFAVLFLLQVFISYACDVCSSSGTNSLNGQLLQNNVSFVGLSWNNSGMTGDAERRYNSHFANLIGGVAIKQKWQIMALIPLQYQIREQDEVRNSDFGLSDAMLLTSWQAYGSPTFKSAKHKIFATAGIKLPTGRFDSFDSEFAPLGTGSVDWLASGQYIFEKKDIGVNNRLDFQLNMKNRNGFRYGNLYRISSFAFLKKEVKKTVFMPFAGASAEYFGKNVSNGFVREASGGYATFAFVGLQTMINEKYTFFVRGDLPIYQQLDSFDGPVDVSYRVQAQFTMIFSGRNNKNNSTIQITTISNQN